MHVCITSTGFIFLQNEYIDSTYRIDCDSDFIEWYFMYTSICVTLIESKWKIILMTDKSISNVANVCFNTCICRLNVCTLWTYTDYQGVSMEALVDMDNAYSKQCKEYFDDFDIISIDLYISMCVFTYVHTYNTGSNGNVEIHNK